MNIQHFVCLFSLLFSFASFSQHEKPLKKVDSLLEIRQPNAAQSELWAVIEKAKKIEDHPTLLEAVPYFKKVLAPLDKEERAALYFKVFNRVQDFPKPSNSIAELQMLQEVAFNNYQWLSRTHLDVYDSINLNEDSVRFEFVLKHIEGLENQLNSLTTYDFQPYRRVLSMNDDSLFIHRTLSDYLVYQLINLYESSVIQHGGTLKHLNSDQKEWYGLSSAFTQLNLQEYQLTGAILRLYQQLELNNQNHPNYLSTAVYQRLHFLKKSFHNLKEVEQAWENQFNSFSTSSARSKFLFEIAKSKYNKGKAYHYARHPELEPLIKEAHEQLTAEMKLFPNNDFKHEIHTLITVINNQEINLTLPNVVRPNIKIPLLIKSRNYSAHVIRIYKIKDFDFVQYSSFQNYLLEENLTLERTLSLDLKDEKLFQERSLELLLDGFSTPGQYFIVATKEGQSLFELAKDNKLWNAEKVISKAFTISTISTTSSTINGEYTMLVLDQSTGKPVEGAEVQLYKHNYRRGNEPQLIKKGTTDKNGLFSHPIRDNGRLFYSVEYKGSFLYGGEYAYKSGKDVKQNRIELLTDRSVYRPGQTVYFKGIAFEGMENEFKATAKKKITITLRDASYQEIYKSTFTSNEFGSVDGSIQLPSSTPLGSFSLVASIDGLFTNSLTSSTQFIVEEYKRPTFEVKLNQPTKEAKLNDTVSVVGNAKAFAGFPIANAQVSYTIYRKWNRYWRFYYSPFSGDLLKEGEVKSNVNGDFKIDFFAEEDPNAVANAYYNYEVRVKVTDLSGETHEQTLSLNLSKVGLSLQVNAVNRFFTHEKETALIEVVNLAGEKQEVYTGKLEVYQKVSDDQFLNRLWENAEDTQFKEEEWAALFPNMMLNSFQNHSQKEKLIKRISFTTGDTLQLNEWVDNKQGHYSVKLYVLMPSGDSIKATHDIEVIDVTEKDLPVHTALWTFVSDDEVKVGESVDFQVGSSFKKSKALISFYRKDKLIRQEWVDLKHRHSQCYTVQEEDRGVLTYNVVLLNNGVFYSASQNVRVPFSNKQLKIKTSTFRDQLTPGQKERWSFTVQDENNEMVNAELAATLYDASLDQFRGHGWGFFPYYGRVQYSNWSNNWSRNTSSFGSGGVSWTLRSVLTGDNMKYKKLLSPPSYEIVNYGDQLYLSKSRSAISSQADVAETEEVVVVTEESGSGAGSDAESVESVKKTEEDKAKPEPVNPRSNFNETAFFYPTIYSNDSNEYVVNFTLPESLTKWKLLMLSHNQEMQIGTFQKEIVAQKELMVTANTPRFVRQGDAIDFSAKVVNLTKEEQTVEVFLKLENPINGGTLNLIGRQPLSKMVTIAAGASEEVVWNMNVGDQEVIQYTITASNESYSDGERNVIPVLSNRVLITETDHVLLRKPGKTSHEFEAFKNQNSTTLDNKSFTVEYTDNLAWNAVMALPYLSKVNDQSATALVNSYYANAIAKHIVNSNPQIEAIFKQWKAKTPDVFLSELEKNEELKTILLKETPWIMEAKNETEQRRRIAQLFELNQLQNNQHSLLHELKKAQNRDGGFGWFGGGKSNAYITQNVLTRFGQLERLGVSIKEENALIQNAERFLAEYHVEKYNKRIKDKKGYTVSAMDMYWLYSRTFFNSKQSAQIDEVINYYQTKLKKEWTRFSPYEQAIIGIYFKNKKMDKEAQLIYASLKDRAKKNTRLGMYWVENAGYYWYQNNIGSQAMIISFFKEMDAPEDMMDDMRLWLILNKEGNAWETGVSTADAVYAVLLTGKDYLSSSKQPSIKVGSQQLVYASTSKANEVEVEWTPGLGQVKNKWTGGEITTNLGEVEVERYTEAPGVLNMYWQYTDELSKIKSSNNQSMSIRKTYRRVVPGEKAETGIIDSTFKIGDKIEIELIVTVDRDLEFVHIKDLRPAGFEPVQTTSGYMYDAGLSYYQSPKDVSMDYFVDYMPKGTYKLTYTVYATHSGNFNSGVAEIQCHYAPKFSGNSRTMEVRIGR